MSGISIRIESRRDSKDTEAILFAGLQPRDFVLVEREWASERSQLHQELLQANVPRTFWPQSHHWNWAYKAPELELLEASGFGVHCQGRWQGVMLTRSAFHSTRSDPDRGKPLVYIDFLEVAPWNWRIPQLGRSGQFKAIGSHLFFQAIEQSVDEGFHGRIGLHSLPQATPFYVDGLGMTSLGYDASKENLLYLELSRQDAERHLEHQQGASHEKRE